MYTIISNVIKSGNYELNDMLRKIDTIPACQMGTSGAQTHIPPGGRW